MAWQGGEESCRPRETIIAYSYNLSMVILSRLFAVGWRMCAELGDWKMETRRNEHAARKQQKS